MNSKYITALLILLLISVCIGLYIFLKPVDVLTSPVLGISKMVFAENLWFPKESSSSADLKAPQVTTKAAFFVETNTGEVLYEKNAHEKLQIASLTKIMTAIIALESKNLTDEYWVSNKAVEMEPDKMYLIAGERLTLEELLDGIFLVSANDGAEVIAEGTFYSREDFIKRMNIKAAQLDMKNTNFINPTGLEEDNAVQLSSAFDVALMSRYAIKKWPKLIEITSNPQIYIPKTDRHQDYDLNSGINLLTTYPGVVGFKTGFTPSAGLTLVTVARRGGKEVLGVLLGSTDRRDDARAMLDYSFKKLGVKLN